MRHGVSEDYDPEVAAAQQAGEPPDGAHDRGDENAPKSPLEVHGSEYQCLHENRVDGSASISRRSIAIRSSMTGRERGPESLTLGTSAGDRSGGVDRNLLQDSLQQCQVRELRIRFPVREQR